MSDSPIPKNLHESAVKLLRARRDLHSLIAAGMLPATRALLDGAPFMSHSIEKDIIAWAKSKLLTLGDGNRLLPTMTNLSNNPTLQSVQVLLYADDGRGDLGADVDRLLVYRSCLGDSSATAELKDQLLSYVCSADVHSYSNFIRRCVGEGMKMQQSSMSEAYARGFKRMTDFVDVGLKFAMAFEWFMDGEPEPEDKVETKSMPPSALDDDAEFLRAVEEDRAEFPRPPAGKLLVVPSFAGNQAAGYKRDLQKTWTGLDGTALPLIGRGNVSEHRASLVGRWPHAAAVIDIILGDLTAGEFARFRPTMLVGPPGSGKTSLVRAIAERVGLPVETFSLAGSSDGALMGTSAQWHSARESVPLQLIKRSKTANPAVIWDEVEKASTDKRNGSALHALLPMLEKESARRIRDLALEVEVDLSAVTHFATANSLDGVPAPLRDRMRILQMPEPGWQHLPALVEGIVTDLMLERGLDGRWVAPLAEDEMHLIRLNWIGGSIRQLQRIVHTIVDGREQLWGKA